MKSLEDTAQLAKDQSQQLGQSLQQSLSDQEAKFTTVFEENRERIAATKGAQEDALKTLSESVASLKEQHEQLSTMLEKTVENDRAMLVDTFEKNMAQIIEHYLLGALGEQYDMKL